MKKKILKTAIITLVTLIVSVLLLLEVSAQQRDQQVWRERAPAQPMHNPGPPQLPGAPTQTPIGSGLVLLLAAGGAYAVKRLREEQQGMP